MANILIDYDSIDYKSYIDESNIRNFLQDNIVKVSCGQKSTITEDATQDYKECVTKLIGDIMEPISQQLSIRLYDEYEKIMNDINEELLSNYENE